MNKSISSDNSHFLDQCQLYFITYISYDLHAYLWTNHTRESFKNHVHNCYVCGFSSYCSDRQTGLYTSKLFRIFYSVQIHFIFVLAVINSKYLTMICKGSSVSPHGIVSRHSGWSWFMLFEFGHKGQGDTVWIYYIEVSVRKHGIQPPTGLVELPAAIYNIGFKLTSRIYVHSFTWNLHKKVATVVINVFRSDMPFTSICELAYISRIPFSLFALIHITIWYNSRQKMATQSVLNLIASYRSQIKFAPRNNQLLFLTVQFNTSSVLMWKSNGISDCLNHWGRDEMDAITQTTFSSAFFWKKMFKFLLKCHWSLFPMVQLIIFKHWFR